MPQKPARRWHLFSLSVLMTLGMGQALAADVSVSGSIEAGKHGAVVSRHLFGQFAEHLGTGIYGGLWVGPDSSPTTPSRPAPRASA